LSLSDAPSDQTPESQPGHILNNFYLVTIKNFGNSPAFRAGLYSNYIAVPFGTQLPLNFNFADLPNRFEKSNITVASVRTTLDRDATFTGKIPLLSEDVVRFIAAQKKMVQIYIWGHIDFCDIYSRRWVRNFSFAYEPWRDTKIGFEPIDRYQEERQDGKC
jgi:hypothetical protein